MKLIGKFPRRKAEEVQISNAIHQEPDVSFQFHPFIATDGISPAQGRNKMAV